MINCNPLLTFHKATWLFLGIGVVCALITSCKGAPRIHSAELSSSIDLPLVTLGPGDDIEIKFTLWPELDSRQIVRPDGKISLMLVDYVHVMGLTPEQLDEHLTKLYEGKIIEPDITVIVHSLNNQRVFVGGEVLSPGIIPMPGPLTVLEAIMSAGGIDNKSAELSNVIVIRQMDGKRYATSLNLQKSLNTPGSEPFYLAPNSIVYVPRTRIVKLNQWVEQHISNMIPDTALDYRITTRGVDHTTTIGITPNR